MTGTSRLLPSGMSGDVSRRPELVGQKLGRLVGRDQLVELAVLPVADETPTVRILRQTVGAPEAAADSSQASRSSSRAGRGFRG